MTEVKIEFEREGAHLEQKTASVFTLCVPSNFSASTPDSTFAIAAQNLLLYISIMLQENNILNVKLLFQNDLVVITLKLSSHLMHIRYEFQLISNLIKNILFR